MKMRTPVTAFQMTSLHWQRSVSVNRTMDEKLKLNQLVYIGAEGHCHCVSAVLSIISIQLYILCLLKQLKTPFEKVYSPRISRR